MGEMRLWLHIYIFDRKIESILNELINIFDFRIYFNVLRSRARVMCEGGSCDASLGITQLRVYGGVDVRL